MGTIGDLLGIDLTAALTPDTPNISAEANSALDEASDVADSSTNDQPVEQHPRALYTPSDDASRDEKANTRHEAVMAAIIAETNLDPSQARSDLTLSGDLDLDDLGLYAVVAAIEHELKYTFTDEEVRSWRTLADIFTATDDSARALHKQR